MGKISIEGDPTGYVVAQCLTCPGQKMLVTLDERLGRMDAQEKCYQHEDWHGGYDECFIVIRKSEEGDWY